MTFLFLLLMMGGETPFFQGNFEQALAAAKSQGKPLMLDVYTDWCGPCKRMNRTTFRDEQVVSLFKEKYLVVKINAEKGEGVQLARKYKVRAYPSLIVLDGDGAVVTRRTGFMDASRLVRWLDSPPAKRDGAPAK